MSHRSAVRSAADHSHSHGFGRAAPSSKYAPPQSGWTLGHGGRQVRVGPVAFWTIVGSLVVMAGWSAVTANYFAFRDDVLTRLLARQAQMQYAYEDRIADLRGQVDRLASRQLLDQEQVESKLEQMARRQAMRRGTEWGGGDEGWKGDPCGEVWTGRWLAEAGEGVAGAGAGWAMPAGTGRTGIRIRMRRSTARSSSRSSGAQNAMAAPPAPARAVRPMRWT